MRHSIVITSDLHLTNRPLDEYRFSFLDWLSKKLTVLDATHLFILGDITDQKDRHQATLVHRILEWLDEVSKKVEVVILKGNHDYIDKNHPFFQFVSWNPRISYFSDPGMLDVDGRKFLMLPHVRGNWKDAWSEWFDGKQWVECDNIFIHQSISGFKTFKDGPPIDVGISRSTFSEDKTTARVLAGDIHMPQRIGNVEYVGAPYPVLFSDDFNPRIIHIRDFRYTSPSKLVENSIAVPAIRKAKVRIGKAKDLLEFGFEAGDQIKVVLRLPRSQYVDWEEHRVGIAAYCKKNGVHLGGVEVEEIVRTKLGAVEVKRPMNGSTTEREILERFCDGRADIDEDTRIIGTELLEWNADA